MAVDEPTDPAAGDAPDADESLLEAEVERFEHEVRRIAAGGTRRALIGFAVGLAAGLVAALLMPRDEGPRRTVRAADRPAPRGHDGPAPRPGGPTP